MNYLETLFLFPKTCTLYLLSGFDNQAFFIWDYNALIGNLPYKDIFYPYGILPYYKDHYFLAWIIYILLIPLVLTTIYVFLRKIVWSRTISIVIFIAFCLFVTFFTGWEVFHRYGILVAFGLFLTQYLYLHKTYKPWQLIGFGSITGVCFSGVTDIGIYCGSIFVLLLVSQPLLQRKIVLYISFGYWYGFLKQMFSFCLGVLLGILPLCIYLFSTHTFFDFMSASVQLPSLALYAKTPFFPGLRSWENIFVFSILFFVIFYFSYFLIFLKRKLLLIHYYEFVLILIIIFFEQKSIIRSIDRTIPFVAVLLFLLLLYEFFVYLKQTHFKTLSVSFVYSAVLVCLLFLLMQGIFHSHRYTPGFTRVFLSSESVCIQKNIDFFTKNTSHKKVVSYLKTQKDFSKKVFSFPFEPVFYVMLSQKTPYYSNTYDSSSEVAQKKQIAFMIKNDIRYVIIDTDKKSLQDEVPEYIRSNTLFAYLLTNYTVVKKIDNFLILRKTKYSNDVFTNKNVPLSYKQYLLTIDLRHIPGSEGIYKYGKIKNMPFRPIGKTKQVTSFDTLLLFSSQTFRVTRNDGVVSQISMTDCQKTPCIVHLSRLPIFFTQDKKYTYSLVSNVKDSQIYVLSQKIDELW